MNQYVKFFIFKMLKLFYSFAPLSLLDRINIYTHRKGFFSYSNKNFFLIHIPKSAGTSVYSALELYDPGHVTWQKSVSISNDIFNKKIVIIMRHPADRLFSTYNYARQKVKKQPFTGVQQLGKFNTYYKFLKNVDTGMLPVKHYFLFPVYKYIKGADAENLIFISFEHLEEGISDLAKMFSLKYKKLPKLNISKNNIKSTVEKRLERSLVEKFYFRDLMLYDQIKNKPLTKGNDVIIKNNSLQMINHL